jgi:hypothetical protein
MLKNMTFLLRHWKKRADTRRLDRVDWHDLLKNTFF